MRQADPGELEAIRRWFIRLAEFVGTGDFEGARVLFAPDMVAFGTFSDFLVGRDEVERAQWRNVWPFIERFGWRTEEIKGLVSPDGLLAVGMGCFDSTGFDERGMPYERPGRATVVLVRTAHGDDWVAAHTHMSLFRGVPQRSHGRRAPAGRSTAAKS